MARAPKFGRTFSRRRFIFFHSRPRFKVPGKKPLVCGSAPGGYSGANAGRISDRLLGWVISLLVHVVALFVFVLAIHLLTKLPAPPPLPIIIPQSFLSGNQFTPFNKDPVSPTHTMTLQDFLGAHKVNHSISSAALSAMLNGSASNQHLFAISLGQGASSSSINGALGAMGIPGKALAGMPAVSFFGVQAQARRVVFLVDHAGRMVGHLYLLKREVRRSIGQLLPFQKFAVIAISGKYKILGPDRLLRASPDNRTLVRRKVRKLIAEGHDYGLLLPFLKPFEAAWAMHPQVIFFLTDGYVDPRLIADIRHLNSKYPVHVCTFTFVGGNQRHQENLRRIAAETAGKFKYVSARALERRRDTRP